MRSAKMQMSCTTFLAGFAAATAAIGFSIAFRERQSRRSRATRKIHERSLRFESLARTLDLAVEMTGAGQKRAMVICGTNASWVFFDVTAL